MTGRSAESGAQAGPRQRSLVGRLLDLLATEHVCTPPDGAATWQAVSEDACIRTAGRIYVCPECGQRLMQAAPESMVEAAR